MLQQLLFICLFSWIFCIPAETHLSDLSTRLKLSKVIVVFRHGKRAPLRAFKFDPYHKTDQGHDAWPEGLGTLVNEGKNQMYKLGKGLRQRYKHLLMPYGNTVAEDVQIVTTPWHRCYQSGAILLSGFYPPIDGHIWNDELLWQPVPIRSGSPDKSYIIFRKESCPRYHKKLIQVQNVIRNENDYKTNYEYLVNYLSNFTQLGTENKKNAIDAGHLMFMGDYVLVKKSLNVKFPDWITDDILARLEKLYSAELNAYTSNPKLRELFTGPLIKDIIHRIQDVIGNRPGNSKFYFYSGHDVSLSALFEECNLKRDFIPTHGASFIFEVYRSSSNNYFIRILFNNDYSLNSINVKVLPNCEEYCPVSKFIKVFEKYLAQDWEKECNL